MPERHDFIDYVLELFGPFGTVSAKRMFGGWGVYLDGLMFALVSREAIWLKGDEINRREYEAAGCELFTYVRGGAQATIGFYRAPAEALDSASAMLPWARSAYAAALRVHARRAVLERERAERVAAKAAARAGADAAAARPTRSAGAGSAKATKPAKSPRAAAARTRAVAKPAPKEAARTTLRTARGKRPVRTRHRRGAK